MCPDEYFQYYFEQFVKKYFYQGIQSFNFAGLKSNKSLNLAGWHKY